MVATDGLWEFMSNEEVMEICKVFHSDSSDPQPLAERLVEEVRERWRNEEGLVDDTTVIVAYLSVPA